MHCGNPTEGAWSLPKRSMANFAAAGQAGPVRIIKRKLKRPSTGPIGSTAAWSQPA